MFFGFILVMVLLCPLTMIVFGYRFKKAPPKKINRLTGYRTERSMKNWDTWTFAHTRFGTLWLRYGVVTLVLSLIAMPFAWGKSDDFIGVYGLLLIMAQMFPMLIPLFIVEGELKRTFDEFGFRK